MIADGFYEFTDPPRRLTRLESRHTVTSIIGIAYRVSMQCL